MVRDIPLNAQIGRAWSTPYVDKVLFWSDWRNIKSGIINRAILLNLREIAGSAEVVVVQV